MEISEDELSDGNIKITTMVKTVLSGPVGDQINIRELQHIII